MECRAGSYRCTRLDELDTRCPGSIRYLEPPTRRGGGCRTGLELAACKRIIDGLGGQVEVTSGAYRGMRVLVMMPRAR